MLNYKLLQNKSDRQKLLAIFIPLINAENKNMSFEIIIQKLKFDFNFDATVDDLMLYYEPTIVEEVEDLQQTMLNLGIQYD